MHASLLSGNLHANGRNPLSLQLRLHQTRSSSSFLIGWLSRQANASLAQHQTAVDGLQGHAQASQTKTARAASRLTEPPSTLRPLPLAVACCVLRAACCELRVACPQTRLAFRSATRLNLSSDPPPPFLSSLLPQSPPAFRVTDA
ncbi:hypothetical protein L1887_53544 [Cichorium endivia]|nr:hypothetical protein L1887_53544 [Cichorium endivia]